MKADWKKIEDMAKIFADPAAFEYNLVKDVIVNHAAIGENIVAAQASYKSEDWLNYGKHVGEAAAKVLLGSTQEELAFAGLVEPEVEEKEQFAKVLSGMLEAYGVDFDVLALLVCIQDEDKALLAASMGW